MAEMKMRLGSRRVCEFLKDNPGATRRQVADGIGGVYETTKKTLAQLERNGYVKRDGRYDSRFTLTGKPFPPSSEYEADPRYVAAKTRDAGKCFRQSTLDRAVYDMVRSGREG